MSGVAPSPAEALYVAVSWWRDGKRPRTGKERIAALDTTTLKTVRDYIGGTDPECVTVSPRRSTSLPFRRRRWHRLRDRLSTGRHRATVIVGTEREGVTASPDGRLV